MHQAKHQFVRKRENETIGGDGKLSRLIEW